MPDNAPLLQQVAVGLHRLEKKMTEEVALRKELLNTIPDKHRLSAENLIMYLSLRNEDIRDLQDDLHILGLSSLASSESHIHRQIQAIMERLGTEIPEDSLSRCTYTESRNLINAQNEALFGSKQDKGVPYIMVTFDSQFAENYAIIKTLLQNGMNVARINCAHDNEATWSRMIQLIKRASRHTGLPCKIYMDLGGPKIRTRLIGKGKEKGKVKIEEGQLIWLSETGENIDPNEIIISPKEEGIIACLEAGHRVYFDDGIIKAVVERKENNNAAVRIIRVSSTKKQIKSDKGLNFPDSDLPISPLTKTDLSHLPFICNHADLVGYSFVRHASDLSELQLELQKIIKNPPHIIIKIETPQAVKNLPALLLQGMKQENFGVMIARGDLAVEIGFERMGEIQEEILWICESAHVPVIWATQVLETLNKSGIATRSEITDASHASMAECVMINKGDHTLEVIETLRDILIRTGGHHSKKRFLFRPLRIAQRFLGS